MEKQSFESYLSEHLSRPWQDQTMEIPNETNLSLFVEVGTETITIAQVKKLLAKVDILLATTKRGDDYAFHYDKLAMIRVSYKEGNRTGYSNQ